MDITGALAAVVLAIVVNVVNTFAGWFMAKKAFGKDLNTFLAIVFGSFGIRACIVIGVVWYLLSVVGVHQVWFSLTFTIMCFVALMGEILFFHRSFEAAKRRIRRPVTDLLKKKGDEMIPAIALSNA